MLASRRSNGEDKVHSKRPGKEVEDAANRNKDMRILIPPHLVIMMLKFLIARYKTLW